MLQISFSFPFSARLTIHVFLDQEVANSSLILHLHLHHVGGTLQSWTRFRLADGVITETCARVAAFRPRFTCFLESSINQTTRARRGGNAVSSIVNQVVVTNTARRTCDRLVTPTSRVHVLAAILTVFADTTWHFVDFTSSGGRWLHCSLRLCSLWLCREGGKCWTGSRGCGSCVWLARGWRMRAASMRCCLGVGLSGCRLLG